MPASELCFLGVKDLAALLSRGEISPVELVGACLDRIDAHDGRVNSFITLFRDDALSEAHKAEQDILRGAYRGPLHGIPFGLKDLFMVRGRRFTLGSKLFHENTSTIDSTVASRLQKAGAILLGKQNMNPLAYGPFATEPGYDYGHTFTPWDLDRISGGSSGGSGAAVAAGFCPFSVGTDTGGSLRIPAAWCAAVALKPTYGRISRYGVQALAWSLDHPGPLTRRVDDCAIVMQALSGYDSRDPSCANVPVPDFSKPLNRDIEIDIDIDIEIKGLRVGLPVEYWKLPMDSEVRYWVEKAVTVLKELGAEIVEPAWPMLAYAENTSNIVLLCEASSAYEEIVKRDGQSLLPALRLRLQAGLLIPAADYLRAQKARALLVDETKKLFENIDLIVGPTMPVTASLPGQTEVSVDEEQIGVVRAMTQFNEVFNLTGNPAMTLPCGFTEAGLPVGLQIVGRHFQEPLVLHVARAFEEATSFWKPVPRL
jgi:aspartyl-tRNA(Asn)/glutamyl-tRNA(Gln) amidotransferase subunit A